MISHVDKKWYPHVWDLINYLYWFPTTQYTTKFYILIKQCLMVWRATVCGFNQSFAYLTGRGKGRIVIFEGIELLMLKVTFKHIKVHSLLQSTWSANHTALKKRLGMDSGLPASWGATLNLWKQKNDCNAQNFSKTSACLFQTANC